MSLAEQRDRDGVSRPEGPFKEKNSMRRIIPLSCTIVALLAPLASIAADTASLKVAGTLSATSCEVSLSGRDTVDLGPVSAGILVPGEDTALPETAAFLTVDCHAAPAKFRLKATDSSGATASTAGSANYGLGTHDGKPIGYFTLSIAGDVMPSDFFVLKSTDAGEGHAWASPVHGKVPFDHDDEAFAFASSATSTEPADLTAIALPLSIQPVLARDLVVNDDVALAGRVTIELFY
jgi:hypothetical protein